MSAQAGQQILGVFDVVGQDGQQIFSVLEEQSHRKGVLHISCHCTFLTSLSFMLHWAPRSLVASSDINNNVVTEHSCLLYRKTAMRKFCYPIGNCKNRSNVANASSTTSLTDANPRIK